MADNIRKARRGAQQAHHLIPTEIAREMPELFRKAARGGFDINGARNGKWLTYAFHHGHGSGKYNLYMRHRIQNWAKKNPNATDAEVAQYMNRLADDMRHFLTGRRGYINDLFD